MKTIDRRTHNLESERSGVTLVVFAIVFPTLLGLLGLIIDAGLLTVLHRQVQNATDAAALAAAEDLVAGSSVSTAVATATTFVQQHNGLPGAEVTVNVPPSSGPYSGSSAHVEVRVRQSAMTLFIQVLGVNREQSVSARAIAGYEPVSPAANVIALNPNARPGLSISGSGSLSVDGGVAVNSEGGGVDEFGQPIGNGSTGVAASVSNNGTFLSRHVQTVGGVNNPANFRQYDSSVSGTPLKTRMSVLRDPYIHLPPPTTSNGADATEWPAVSVTGNQTVTLYPGVYPSISVSSGTVTFAPGIYIIRGGQLRITEQNVNANGAMFYITGRDYNVNTGLPDAADGNQPPPAPGNTTFGSVTINAGLQFSGYNDPSSPFHGMMFYQRRRNTQAFNIQGNSSSGNMVGTIYAKWAPMKITGQGTYGSRFVVSQFEASGSGAVTILDAGELTTQSNQVFLVE